MAKIDPPVSDQSPSIHPDSDPCLDSVSDLELQRTRIRQRWELASALNFLHVFKDVIGNELKISGEEIENGLITPNDDLAKVHIVLLKGIPPVNKNMTNGDAWMSIVCKKLVTWWPWVAEGDIPLKADQGKEIQIYKTFDPINRVMILKALCEVRAQVILIGFAADAGYLLGDTDKDCKEYKGPRWRAATIFINGFWLLDLANNTVQGSSRALLADFSGPHQCNSANEIFCSWMAIGNILGFSAGASGQWQRCQQYK